MCAGKEQLTVREVNGSYKLQSGHTPYDTRDNHESHYGSVTLRQMCQIIHEILCFHRNRGLIPVSRGGKISFLF